MNAAIHPPLSTEALARATLTFCLDGADALMYAALKGAGSAQEVLELIIASRPDASGQTEALHRLDQVFATGLSRWGRKPTAQALAAFHRSLDGWHARLAQLPSLNWQQLGDWFTMDGAQWIVGPDSALWPRQLMDLSTRKDWAPPLCLWGIGDAEALTCCDNPVAVVGSRGVNDYGRGVAREVAACAACDGHLVVSGGALGTDAAAHWGALSATQHRGLEASGRTVAVFAGGLNHIGPPSNLRLFDQITANGGALISELCPSTIPEPRRFLIRNRIIAALASTVVIAQARLRSGALNTAGWANELGRTVVAAPGDITMPHNAGCNRLISRAEALILTSPPDIREFCHAPHPPLGSDGFNDKETDGPPAGDDHLTDSQRTLIDTIRLCHRRHLTATPDALLSCMMRQANASKPTIAQIMADLGTLEVQGLVEYNGAANLTTG
ncbi:DNA-processing protein DprA [Bifidobacterium panos]|uniref:DNA processing protein DprA n=1 Tax=Bifidobacterium panos TaxID=2675321 RepID=A0ABX1SW15_9BIFI|nr:DNA-processing protein DprA [Bifidobacterium sp. DSM 109963]NMN01464.1 DNA processing protein DprA [Bifidobacterium sp. DSM 109963]